MPEVFTISSPLTLHDMLRKVAPEKQVHLCFQSVLLGKSEIDTLYQHTTAVVKLELAETLSYRQDSDVELFLQVLCSCASLELLVIRSSQHILVPRLYRFWHRTPTTQSLASLNLAFVRLCSTWVALLGRTLDGDSALRKFRLTSWNTADADLAPLFVNENQLDGLFLSLYDWTAEEAFTLLKSSSLKKKIWKELYVRPYSPDRRFNGLVFKNGLQIAERFASNTTIHWCYQCPEKWIPTTNFAKMTFSDRLVFSGQYPFAFTSRSRASKCCELHYAMIVLLLPRSVRFFDSADKIIAIQTHLSPFVFSVWKAPWKCHQSDCNVEVKNLCSLTLQRMDTISESRSTFLAVKH